MPALEVHAKVGADPLHLALDHHHAQRSSTLNEDLTPHPVAWLQLQPFQRLRIASLDLLIDPRSRHRLRVTGDVQPQFLGLRRLALGRAQLRPRKMERPGQSSLQSRSSY